MATENPKSIVSRIAGANVTNKRAVVEIAGGIVDRASVQGQRINGVVCQRSLPLNASSQAITAGDDVAVAKTGDVIMEAGAAIADAAEVMVDNVGRVITFAVAGAQYAIGKLVNGSFAAAAGDEVTVELYDYGTHL